ncbi:MAG: cation-transporting P-type ATPase [Clostridia bacterium]|nr:cation-transporting P-type ATPase [Clostridia bacterium]
MIDPHIPDLSTLEKKLGTSLSEGLPAREARVRLEKDKKHDNKSLFVSRRRPAWTSLLTFAGSPYALLLLTTSLLTALFGKTVLGWSVFAITLAATALGGILILNAQKTFGSMGEYASPMVKVKRGGNVFYTDGRNLVEGDVILLKGGDLLTCDARLIRSEGLTVDELIIRNDGIIKRRVDKHFDAVCDEKNCETPDAANMLYAGSAVISGQATALVVATGEDVYLHERIRNGELGGKDSEPAGAKAIKPTLYKISFLCASGILILSLIGLMTLHGKEIFVCNFTMLLSAVFLVTTELLSGGARYVFSSYVKRLAQKKRDKNKNALRAYVRSVKALDTLATVSDLVFVGSAGLCGGSFSLSATYTANGVIENLDTSTNDGSRILSLIHTYVKAQREGGIENDLSADGCLDALYAHLRASKFDISGASLAIKSLYFAKDAKNGFEYACAETDNEIFRTSLITDSKILTLCDYIQDGAHTRAINDRDIAEIKEFAQAAAENGLRCLYCISEKDRNTVLEGVITLYQPEDKALEPTVAEMKRFGIKATVLLTAENDINSNLVSNCIEKGILSGNTAFASEFKKNDKSVIDGLGRYDAYVGFSVREYAELIAEMRKRGAKIAAYGVANEYNEILARADIAISCDTIEYSSDKYRESVYERVAPEGRDTNERASQQTRLLSKVIVRRANESGGGAAAAFKAIKTSRKAYVSFAQALLLFTLLMSGLVSFTVMTVLTGNILLDPLQTVALSAMFAFLSVTVFSRAEQTDRVLAQSRDFTSYPIELIKQNIPSVISRALVAAVIAILIKIFDYAGIFGTYTTYKLPVFICLLLTVFVEVFMINRKFTKKGEGRSNCWLKVIIAYTVAIAICAFSTQNVFSSEFYPMGWGTREYFVIPAYIVLYAIAILVVYLISRNRNKR